MALGGLRRPQIAWIVAVLLLSALSAGDLSSTAGAPLPVEGLDPEDPAERGAGCGLAPRTGPSGALTDATEDFPKGEACRAAIRPGAQMTHPYRCSFNFLFTDGEALYIGTAGHCTEKLGERVNASGVGSFGEVVYRVSQGGPDDFALVEIDQDKVSLAEPTVCGVGGPSATNDGHYPSGEAVYEYGWGFATGVHPGARERVHRAFNNSTEFPSWNGVGSGGDSGAPVITDTGRAYAVHTAGHALVAGISSPFAGVVLEGGPHIQYVLGLTSQAGFELEVVQGAPFEGL